VPLLLQAENQFGKPSHMAKILYQEAKDFLSRKLHLEGEKYFGTTRRTLFEEPGSENDSHWPDQMIYCTPRVRSRLGPSSHAPMSTTLAPLLVGKTMCNQAIRHIVCTKPISKVLCMVIHAIIALKCKNKISNGLVVEIPTPHFIGSFKPYN
jgi:hypothetical protein